MTPRLGIAGPALDEFLASSTGAMTIASWLRITLERAVAIPKSGNAGAKATLDDHAYQAGVGAFDHSDWNALLQAYVTPSPAVLDAGVTAATLDYGALSADPRFDAYLARLAAVDLASLQPAERLALYINAYNAFTIYGVVSNPGITSVQDVRVKSLAMLKEGQGFFYSLRFKMGKRWINLYDLENKIIRGFGDARIHAAINCASKSCPMLSNKAYIPQKLDKALGNAMTSMLNNSIHLEVDNANRQVRASEIFKWFLEDFNATSPTDLYNYWLPFLDEERRKMLEQAQAQNYTIQWTPYDWALNGPGLLPPEEG